MRTAFIAATALCSAAALAGPLNSRWVAPEATWVVHVDVEAAVTSTLGRFVLDQHGGDFKFDGLAEFERELGIDPTKDIRGVTIYGRGAKPSAKDAIVIVSASAAVDALVEKLSQDGQARTITEDDLTIYVWEEDGTTRYGSVRNAGDDERIVFVAEDKDSLVAGMRVAGGGGTGRSGFKPSKGSILYVRADDISGLLDDAGDAPAFARKVQGMLFDFGENGDEMFADLTVTAGTSEDASTLLQAAQGLMAMGKLLASDEPELAEFAKMSDSVKLSADGTKLIARCRMGTDELVETLKKLDHGGDEEAGNEEKADDEEKPRKK